MSKSKGSYPRPLPDPCRLAQNLRSVLLAALALLEVPPPETYVKHLLCHGAPYQNERHIALCSRDLRGYRGTT